MKKIEYLGEYEDGTVFCNCAGKSSTPYIRKKAIFGVVFEVGKPKEVPVSKLSKFMATGLFKLK